MAWITDPTNELLLHLVDARGARATNQYWVAPGETNPAAGAPAAIADAVQSISADEVASVEVLRRASWDTPVVPGDGPYPRAADKVKLELGGADGSDTLMELPGPNEIILEAGKINVDQTEATFAAALTVILANCKSAEGATLIALKKGYRRRPPRRKQQ